jgi:hypothetical protein
MKNMNLLPVPNLAGNSALPIIKKHCSNRQRLLRKASQVNRGDKMNDPNKKYRKRIGKAPNFKEVQTAS